MSRLGHMMLKDSVLQAACYGCGVMAQYGGEEYITACTGLLEAGNVREKMGPLADTFLLIFQRPIWKWETGCVCMCVCGGGGGGGGGGMSGF